MMPDGVKDAVIPATAQTHEVPCSALSTIELSLPVEHIRPMRGGSQPHLMRCSDGHYYVVKFGITHKVPEFS